MVNFNGIGEDMKYYLERTKNKYIDDPSNWEAVEPAGEWMIKTHDDDQELWIEIATKIEYRPKIRWVDRPFLFFFKRKAIEEYGWHPVCLESEWVHESELRISNFEVYNCED